MKKIYHITGIPLSLFGDPVAYEKFITPRVMKRFLKVQKKGKMKTFNIEFIQTKKDKYRRTVTCNLIFTIS